MALARIKTWVSEILKSADLNAEFNNILANPISLISPTTGAINFNNQAHTNFILENVATTPTPAAASIGRVVYNTVLALPQVDQGTLARTVPLVLSTATANNTLLIGTSSGAFSLSAGTSTPGALVVTSSGALSWVMGSSGSVLTISSSGSAPSFQAPAAPVVRDGLSQVIGLQGAVSTGQTASFQTDGGYRMVTTTLTGVSVTATSSFSINIGTAGPAAGGRDQAGALTSTFVHLYAISTGALSTAPAGIASNSAPPTGPTLPTSYSAWAYLGAAPYSSSSTQFTFAMQVTGNLYSFEAMQTVASCANSTALTNVSVSSYVPSNARKYYLNAAIGNSVAGANTFHLQITSSGGDWFTRVFTGQLTNYENSQLVVPSVARQTTYWWGTAPAAQSFNADLQGYAMPTGDA